MPRALVTGAGRGVGRALSEALAARGFDLTLLARDEAALGAAAGEIGARFEVHCDVMAEDLADPAGLERAAVAAREADVLVNNAGAGLGRWFGATEWADEQHMLALNVIAPARLLHAALPGMQRRGFGRVLNVSSVAGSGPAWQGATYGASKACITRLTEDLAYSRAMRSSPVAVTALVLGHVDTEFHERAGLPPPPRLLTLRAQWVAERAVRVLLRRRPPVRYVPAARYHVLERALHHLPHRLMTLPHLADDLSRSADEPRRPAEAPGRSAEEPSRAA
ncbi:SDR family NAD(P)-dependent oxidoreductase [Streptomyces sp. URMC 127]|uniref:SDR family NAD(P)-dependent oxidoreductase n=1 Tax=Streptomyces sp. URMC 127 TaxID=3423402 RepID=UPI003F1A3A70